MINSKPIFDISSHVQRRKIETEVENRTAYTIDFAELNIYETYHFATEVELHFGDPILASMIRGKKIMHIDGIPSFDFFPGESVVMARNETMCIDFPEATQDNPTQCLALAISQDKVSKIVDVLNDKAPLVDTPNGWKFAPQNFYMTNDQAINNLLSRLIYIFTENNKAKDVFANLVMQELAIRLMQTQARQLILQNFQQFVNTNRIAYAVEYIQKNLHQNINIKTLCEKACMSEPNFFRCFKQQFGITPIDFINQQRIQLATRQLKTTDQSIADICFACGFNNLNHFIKLFKKHTNETPAQYRKQYYTSKNMHQALLATSVEGFVY
jgi:AraC family transcriptional regulator